MTTFLFRQYTLKLKGLDKKNKIDRMSFSKDNFFN